MQNVAVADNGLEGGGGGMQTVLAPAHRPPVA